MTVVPDTPFDYDAELRAHHEHFRAATDIRPHDRVLDVGCGTGQATREAARAAFAGSALGVDVSAPLLERARQLSDDEGLRNVRYLLADAGAHRFPSSHFDVCVSRFGSMFFADPVAAFTTIGRALRPGARLVLLVWQCRERNEWAYAIHQALTGTATSAGADLEAFSLGDPATTNEILTATGQFTDVTFTDVHEPVYYGTDSTAAYDAVLKLHEPTSLLSTMDTEASALARQRLRATLAAHDTGEGVYFDSRAWLVTARRH